MMQASFIDTSFIGSSEAKVTDVNNVKKVYSGYVCNFMAILKQDEGATTGSVTIVGSDTMLPLAIQKDRLPSLGLSLEDLEDDLSALPSKEGEKGFYNFLLELVQYLETPLTVFGAMGYISPNHDGREGMHKWSCLNERYTVQPGATAVEFQSIGSSV
jgi:hypothetical protein